MLGINGQRSLPPERFSRSGVERERDGVKLLLGVDRQIRALGHVLAQQSVRILVGTTLLWAVRVSKVDLDAGAFSQNFMIVHFASLAIGHGLAQRSRLTVEHGREAVDHGAGAGAVHLGQHHETGRAFDQRAD
jgi:hypothetical protein